ANQDHVSDVGNLDACFSDNVVEWLAGALQQVLGQVLELGTREVLVQVHWALWGNREVLQGDVGAGSRRQFLLGLLSSFFQTLQGNLVLGQVCALGLGLRQQPVDNALIPVVAAQAVVACGGADLDGREAVVVLANFQQGNVEGTAAEVEDQDEFVFVALFQAVSQCSCGWLVDDAQHVQASDLAGFLGSLALSVVEVSRNGDHSVGDLFAQVRLSVVLQLHQGTSRDFLCGVLLVIDVDGPVGTHVALDRSDGAVNVVYCLALGDIANQDFAALRESNDGRGSAVAFRVCDNGWLTTFEHGYDRVGGSQVNAYGTRHNGSPLP